VKGKLDEGCEDPLPPPIVPTFARHMSHLGRSGADSGQMPGSQRNRPKTKHEAIEFRSESTPALRKQWACSRNNLSGATFRPQHADALRPFWVGQ